MRFIVFLGEDSKVLEIDGLVSIKVAGETIGRS